LILTCEKCDTRFRLDESRLPAKGARVRCSRCKHAFFVQPPGTAPADAIQELASDAARTGRPAKPDVSWDLDESADPGSTIQRARKTPPAESPAAPDDESDWRFEDEVPELGDSGASLDLPNGEAPALSAEADANESSFAQLGDPESWDLLATSSGDLDTSGAKAIGGLQAPPPRVPAPEPPRARVAEAAPRRAPPVAVEPEAEPPIAAAPPRAVAAAPPSAQLAGWGATAALATLLLAGALRPTPIAVGGAASLAVGPVAVENVRGRLVDNVFVGPLWVVSGELHNATREPKRLDSAVGALLLDRSGDPIGGAVALAQPAIDADRLHVEDPQALRDLASDAARQLATASLAPDARIAFDAVFAGAPREAARFAIGPQQVPAPPAPPEPARAAAAPAAAPTDPPPSAP
jgi:predicted Zn finger-like uncharacterized protein